MLDINSTYSLLVSFKCGVKKLFKAFKLPKTRNCKNCVFYNNTNNTCIKEISSTCKYNRVKYHTSLVDYI